VGDLRSHVAARSLPPARVGIDMSDETRTLEDEGVAASVPDGSCAVASGVARASGQTASGLVFVVPAQVVLAAGEVVFPALQTVVVE
jgi:hypothetical protein